MSSWYSENGRLGFGHGGTWIPSPVHPGMWFISCSLLPNGNFGPAYHAIVDDFGNLVEVPR